MCDNCNLVFVIHALSVLITYHIQMYNHTPYLSMCGIHTVLCSGFTVSIVVCSHCTWYSWCFQQNLFHTHNFLNVHLTHAMSHVVSGCVKNQQKMVPSGDFSSTQPWRLCTPPLRVSPTLWRVIGRRVGPGVTPWTQQNPLHMLRLGSDMLFFQLHCFLPVIVSAHHIHVTFSHLLTSPLSFLVVSHDHL